MSAERPPQRFGPAEGEESKRLEVELHPAGSDGETHVVEVRGEIDLATVSLLEEQLDLACARDGRAVIADLSGCDFIDSAGICALLRAAEEDGASSRLIAVVVRKGPVRQILAQTGVDRVFTVLAMPAEARDGGGERASNDLRPEEE